MLNVRISLDQCLSVQKGRVEKGEKPRVERGRRQETEVSAILIGSFLLQLHPAQHTKRQSIIRFVTSVRYEVPAMSTPDGCYRQLDSRPNMPNMAFSVLIKLVISNHVTNRSFAVRLCYHWMIHNSLSHQMTSISSWASVHVIQHNNLSVIK